MYKSETRRYIEKALTSILAQGGALPGLDSCNANEISENISMLAKLLTDQLWAEGYELEPRRTHTTISKGYRDAYYS